MGLDNRTANREANADPIGFRRVKTIEDAIEFSQIQPDPSVLDRDGDRLCPIGLRSDRQYPWPISERDHSFGCIGNEVHQNLLQLDRIAKRGWQSTGQFGMYRDPLPF